MKYLPKKYPKMLGILSVCLLLLSFQAISQSAEPKCYVVVGAFKFYKNAENFTERVKSKGLSAQYKLNTYRQLYYVYSYESENREDAKQELYRVRDAYPDLYKAWLYAGNFAGPHIPESEWGAQEVTSEEPEIIEEKTEPIVEEMVEEEVQKPEEVIEPESTVPTWKVYINATNVATLEEVKGDFLIFDAERNQQIKEVPAHELLTIEDPNNRTNRIRVESDIFGFHEIEHTFDLDEPLEGNQSDIVETLGDTIVLNFKLQRLRQGDVSTLWKVYFYKDAAIMREESIHELNELLSMMRENKNIKIKIHGHTNGNAFGEVKYLDESDKQFFSINGAYETDMASARKLSEYRAYTIQQWLVSQGIDEDRMKIKGWGGKKMIYDKFDSQADKNVRVEIEITDD